MIMVLEWIGLGEMLNRIICKCNTFKLNSLLCPSGVMSWCWQLYVFSCILGQVGLPYQGDYKC